MNTHKKHFRIRIYLYRILVLFGMCLIASCSASNANDEPTWETILHEEYNFAISYRSDWIAEQYSESGKRGDQTTKFQLSSARSIPFSEVPISWISIKLKPFSAPTVEDVVTWGDERLDRNESEPGVQFPSGYQEFLYEEEVRDIGLIAKRRYTYFGLDNGDLIIEEVYIPRANDMIIIRLQAHKEIFDEVYPTFDKVSNSFQTVE